MMSTERASAEPCASGHPQPLASRTHLRSATGTNRTAAGQRPMRQRSQPSWQGALRLYWLSGAGEAPADLWPILRKRLFGDPRFVALSEAEPKGECELSISLLGPLQPIPTQTRAQLLQALIKSRWSLVAITRPWNLSTAVWRELRIRRVSESPAAQRRLVTDGLAAGDAEVSDYADLEIAENDIKVKPSTFRFEPVMTMKGSANIKESFKS